MGVILKRQRDGSLREHWYGHYAVNGRRRVFNLNLKWQGTPPASKSLRDPGDARFEASRKEAEELLAQHIDEASHKGRAEHLTERLIESKTGRPVEYVRIAELPQRWRKLGREQPASERYLAACDGVFARFSKHMREKHPEKVQLYEVTLDDAAEFVADSQKRLARKTVRDTLKLLNKSFARWLPVGSANPFMQFVGRRSAGAGDTVHRKPFTPEELRALLAASRADEFLYPLIVTAACTGLRRGDVCTLRWSAVDWAANMLTVKTSKTEAEVEIPIFPPLRAVLEARQGNGSEYVFPAAARMLAERPDELTWQFKKLVVRALGGMQQPALPAAAVPAAELVTAGSAAICDKVAEGPRRDRMLDILRRYMGGQSFRQIVEATQYSKGAVSQDLHKIEEWIGRPVLRTASGESLRAQVTRLTRVDREQGQRAASVRDWHALRATFVTLALAAGVPVEMVRRVTGHATVEVVLKHYFRPDREHFRNALAVAMPEVLTGVKPARLKPVEEMAVLVDKLATGKATEEDKARLRKLAAKV